VAGADDERGLDVRLERLEKKSEREGGAHGVMSEMND
jgi:hypothetical protein